eukprot:TRINITY_DN1613_c0_g1_i14.p1 TRINITY_DN1613_c0_g1~~TRINITY_DN1613_c0_g1_i14.p1  ORF type:complete len:462 (+),score=69.51 TRINITY_DN1613_c0_g1_i14:9-1394(+)
MATAAPPPPPPPPQAVHDKRYCRKCYKRCRSVRARVGHELHCNNGTRKRAAGDCPEGKQPPAHRAKVEAVSPPAVSEAARLKLVGPAMLRAYLNECDPKHVFVCACGGQGFAACASGCGRVLCGECVSKPCIWCNETGTAIDSIVQEHESSGVENAKTERLFQALSQVHKESGGKPGFEVFLPNSHFEDPKMSTTLLRALHTALCLLQNRAVAQHFAPHDRSCSSDDPRFLAPATAEEVDTVQQHFFDGMLENLPHSLTFEKAMPGFAFTHFDSEDDAQWDLVFNQIAVYRALQEGPVFQKQFEFVLAVVALREFGHWKLHHFRQSNTPTKMAAIRQGVRGGESGFWFEAECFGGYFEPGKLLDAAHTPCILFKPAQRDALIRLVPQEWMAQVTAEAASAPPTLLRGEWQHWRALHDNEYRLRKANDRKRWRDLEEDVPAPYETLDGFPLLTCFGPIRLDK